MPTFELNWDVLPMTELRELLDSVIPDPKFETAVLLLIVFRLELFDRIMPTLAFEWVAPAVRVFPVHTASWTP